MKVFAISRDKKFFKIGEDTNSAQWYGYSDKVAKFMTNVNNGDTVSIRSAKGDDGKLTILFIKKGEDGTGSAQQGPTSSASSGASAPAPSVEYQKQKHPDEAQFIKNQAVGHMVSRALGSLQGQVDLTNIDDVIKQLYKTFKTEVDNA